ncbi:MAG: hypothetical protein KC646_05740 [Candidatus Cloacimonetes bacterium]|nr:hypothetical protein [Candidatus Cloacimonadota bacterium]
MYREASGNFIFTSSALIAGATTFIVGGDTGTAIDEGIDRAFGGPAHSWKQRGWNFFVNGVAAIKYAGKVLNMVGKN